jgi:hypothetical protein
MATLFGCGSASSKTESFVVDQSDPTQVLQAVIDIANGAAPHALSSLCDPLHQNDLDTQRICDQAAHVDPQGSFALYFGGGKRLAEPRIQGDTAWIPFQFGPAGAHQDTLCLIRRADLWYLLNFGEDAAL